MLKRPLWIRVLGLLIVFGCLAGCQNEPTPTAPPPTPEEVAPTVEIETAEPEAAALDQGGVYISEVLPGIPGNNNFEFVELYNAGTRPVDLNGWSLWYLLSSGQEEQLVYAWERAADLPGHGHFLLIRAGQELGIAGDAEYDLSLFERKGGLLLRDASEETVDMLGWGEAPPEFVAGSPAAAPEGGASLERLPGGEAGNGRHAGDNAADFQANNSPAPQNSGSDLTPGTGDSLTLSLEMPGSVAPGSEIEAMVTVMNQTGSPLHDLRVSFPLPENFTAGPLPAGAEQEADRIQWTIPELEDGATETTILRLISPWTYLETRIQGAFVETAEWPLRGYGPPLPLAVAGGAIPIATARTLDGTVVTIEGIATMYTDAFYAGSTGTKFYLEDKTGGIQVYCPGGLGLVQVALGDRVRVTGEIDIYRSSLEIIPGTYPDDVEVLERDAGELSPRLVSIPAAGGDESLVGRLIEIEGVATRIEEFSYSYEVDLTDDQGNTQLLYIEKETGISVEPLELGRRYRATGISERYDTFWQLKPRLQADLVTVFPPELMLEVTAQNSVQPGERITYALTAYNHTQAPLTNVRINAGLPDRAASLSEILDDGAQEGASVIWTIADLAPNGGSATVRYSALVSQEAEGQITTPAAQATADQWPEPARTQAYLTFIGSGVPIWAIQGSGDSSPYVRNQASTEGVVIGVFPELSGFWIQEVESDSDPATSAGLLVLVDGEIEIAVALGDLVQVTGRVRERSGQTLLHLQAAADLTVVSAGNELPEAVELDPPRDRDQALVYYEALEGMLVQVTEGAVAVGPTSKYGETPLLSSQWGVDRVMHGDPTGWLIFLDDGSETTHTELGTLPYALQSGDLLLSAVGPLAFSYDNFKIEPIAIPEIAPSERPLPMLAPPPPNGFSIATFNVENLFDFQEPNPSDPPMPSLGQYRIRLSKVAEAIRAMGAPTIVGLQEVENIGILEDLAEQEAIHEFDYQPFLIEGTDSRGIDVGYLVRGDQAAVEGATAYPAPEGITSRPPLLITVTLKLEGSPAVYVLNNHFTSMSEGEEATEPRRNAQALWNAALVAQILSDEPEALVAVLGDLNSFYDSLPLESLRENNLRHVYQFLEPDRPYTYIYQGESETLDHILVTPSLYQLLSRVEVLHIDADYPLPAADDASPRSVSDHDPLVAVFSFD